MAKPHVLEVTLAGGGGAWKLPGPGVQFLVHNVKRVSGLERGLIEHVPRLPGRIVLPLLDGAVALPAAAAVYSPDARVDVVEFDAFRAQVSADKLSPLPNVRHVVAADVPEAGAAAQAAAFTLHTARDRLLALDMIERLVHVMPDRSELLVAIARRRVKDAMSKLNKITTGGATVSKSREGIVFRGRTARKKAQWTPRIARFGASTPRAQIEMCTRPGVFSHGRPDPGGTAIAESAEALPSHRVLDLGCGAGLVGLLLAAEMREGGEVTGEVVLVDSNARAIECAKQNIAANEFGFVRAVLSHAYEGDGDFDVVVGNPPYYAGLRISRRFIDTAMAALKPGGAAYFVSKHGRDLAEYAKSCGFAVESRKRRGYDITVARKPGSG